MWIGQNVTVLPGVHIGDGAIIAANSVVAKDVPPYCIAGGNPCRVIRRRFDEELTAYLLELQWWDWDAGKNLPQHGSTLQRRSREDPEYKRVKESKAGPGHFDVRGLLYVLMKKINIRITG